MSESVRPQRQQPIRLPCPWDSPGKNTGVGCHFLLQCMKVKSEREVAQSCLTPSNPMDCSPPGSSVHGIFQARVLERGDKYIQILYPFFTVLFSYDRVWEVLYIFCQLFFVCLFFKNKKKYYFPSILCQIMASVFIVLTVSF